MIARLVAFTLVLLVLGFALFAVTLGEPAPADAPAVEAVVVITGGTGRIEHGVDLVARGKARRMLIAGVDPSVTKADLVRRLGGRKALFDCCIDLGSESVDTRSNAEEAHRWLRKHGFRRFRLVTSDWHMHRADYEFRQRLGKDYVVVDDAVKTEPRLMTLTGEYAKYVLRRLSVWLDI